MKKAEVLSVSYDVGANLIPVYAFNVYGMHFSYYKMKCRCITDSCIANFQSNGTITVLFIGIFFSILTTPKKVAQYIVTNSVVNNTLAVNDHANVNNFLLLASDSKLVLTNVAQPDFMFAKGGSVLTCDSEFKKNLFAVTLECTG